jgi:hypothetical protein
LVEVSALQDIPARFLETGPTNERLGTEMKRLVTGWVGAGLLAAVAAGPALGSDVRTIPDVQQLYGSATQTVRHADHGLLAAATLLEADGYSSGGKGVTTAAGITHWHFVFNNSTPHSPYVQATVNYGPSPRAYGPVTPSKTPYLEDVKIAKAPKLSLHQAVGDLRKDGEHRAFNSVILRNPLNPPFDGVRYIFGVVASGGTTYVEISASTGKVIR